MDDAERARIATELRLLASRVEPDPPEVVAGGGFRFSARSLERMEGVHPDLRAVAHRALQLSAIDFAVTATGGVRDAETQRRLVAKGASKTLDSRHRTGHALDVVAFVDGRIDWSWAHCQTVHEAFARAAEELEVSIRWGGDWDGDGDTEDQKFRDGYHHELPKSVYGTRTDSLAPKALAFLASIGEPTA